MVTLYHAWAGKVAELPFDGSDAVTSDICRLLGIEGVPHVKVLPVDDDYVSGAAPVGDSAGTHAQA